jgi:hypothetical protein
VGIVSAAADHSCLINLFAGEHPCGCSSASCVTTVA